jgi:putative transposase
MMSSQAKGFGLSAHRSGHRTRTPSLKRWIETLRADCLDWLLVLGSRHLDRVLRTYVKHYNRKRPHRGLQLLAPETAAPVPEVGVVPHVQRRDLLGGLIHEYEIAA